MEGRITGRMKLIIYPAFQGNDIGTGFKAFLKYDRFYSASIDIQFVISRKWRQSMRPSSST